MVGEQFEIWFLLTILLIQVLMIVVIIFSKKYVQKNMKKVIELIFLIAEISVLNSAFRLLSIGWNFFYTNIFEYALRLIQTLILFAIVMKIIKRKGKRNVK